VAFVVLAMAVILAAVLLFRPGDDEEPGSTPAPTGSSSASSSAVPTPATTSEEAFCAAFRRLAAAQGQYVATPDERAIEVLRAAADDLVSGGVPETMSLPARGGYHTVVEGVYETVGLSLDRSAVGALDEPVSGEEAAFSSYLTQFCPA
jgi:hypothetical protein